VFPWTLNIIPYILYDFNGFYVFARAIFYYVSIFLNKNEIVIDFCK
jgi:hypothetical protein